MKWILVSQRGVRILDGHYPPPPTWRLAVPRKLVDMWKVSTLGGPPTRPSEQFYEYVEYWRVGGAPDAEYGPGDTIVYQEKI